MATKKTEKLSMRQEMRMVAGHQLTEVLKLVRVGVTRALEEADVDLAPTDVMRLCVGGQTKTLEDRLIGQIANGLEAKIIKLWNDQQKLALEDSDGE